MKICTECKEEAVIYLKDLKVEKESSILLCEKHFNIFCLGLIKSKVKYAN